MTLRRPIASLLAAGALALGGCGAVAVEAPASAGPYDDTRHWRPPYASYYDWFTYTPGSDWPYYHPYPNLDYYVEYRPIYPEPP